jgi:hypothetical protein
VLRSARPALELAANALNTRPSGVGFAYGDGPTAMIIPTSSSATKKRRCRQRTTPAASRPTTTSP